MRPRASWLTAVSLVALIALPKTAFSQGDEIQVYDGGLAAPGVFNLTWHNNYTPDGVTDPAFPGAVISDQSLNGVTEWALGVTDWFEAGLYLPLYSIDKDQGFVIDGFKLRFLFAVPHADDRKFFYGANFEFSRNNSHWDTERFTSEVRPIIGWHLSPVDIVFNPIVDTSYDGFDNLVFVPSTRIAYNLSPNFAIAAEEYADFGRFGGFSTREEQAHQIFAVVDHSSRFVDVEVGVGFGLTDAADKLQLKLILARDLNSK